jgi:hypothetical protein
MPFVYDLSLATPGNLTTNGTPATETDALFVKAGARDVYWQSMSVIGKAAAATTLSGIAFRLFTLSTASTAGTGITPTKKDPGAQAAKATSASRPTIGSTRLNRLVFGCGVSSQGGFVARDQQSMVMLEAAGAFSMDVADVSGTASLPYEFSAEIVE